MILSLAFNKLYHDKKMDRNDKKQIVMTYTMFTQFLKQTKQNHRNLTTSQAKVKRFEVGDLKESNYEMTHNFTATTIR